MPSKIYFSFLYGCCLQICLCTTREPGAYGDQRRASDPLGLEWQEFVSCPVWVLGPELQSSARIANTPHHWAPPSPVLNAVLFSCFWRVWISRVRSVNSLADKGFASIPSQSSSCPFTLPTTSFTLQKLSASCDSVCLGLLLPPVFWGLMKVGSHCPVHIL